VTVLPVFQRKRRPEDDLFRGEAHACTSGAYARDRSIRRNGSEPIAKCTHQDQERLLGLLIAEPDEHHFLGADPLREGTCLLEAVE